MNANAIDRWTRILVSMMLGVAVLMASSPARAEVPLTGELLVTGNGVVVNGEAAANGRTLTVPSSVMTTGTSIATLNFSKAGKLQLAPGSTFTVDGSGDVIRGTLSAGSVTIVNSANPVSITTLNGKTVIANAGDVVAADPAGAAQNPKKKGIPLWGYAAIGGIIGVIIIVIATGGSNCNGTASCTS